jgi:polar amino acid transport system substrate-binding protein
MPKRQSTNRCIALRATILGLFLALASTLDYQASQAQAQQVGYKLPQFRDVEEDAAAPPAEAGVVFQLLGDQDFPPFSFASQSGPAGLAVELGLAACAEAKVQCQVTLLPFNDLLPALAERRGDAVISGPRIDAEALAAAEATRPYFRTLARFAAQSGNTLAMADPTTLSGKRIGVVKATSHEAWLTAYYSSADVEAFDTMAAAQTALRTGNVDVIFGDNLQLIYWVAGEASQNCCKLLDGAFSDFDFFSRNIAFFVRGDRLSLRKSLDYGLDQLQLKGTTEKVFNRYVPLPPW